MRNILKRAGHSDLGQGERSSWAFADFVLDEARRSLTQAEGGEIAVTRAEFDLLAALVRANGRVLSRDQLLDAIRQDSEGAQPKLVDVLISRLRKKVEPDAKPPQTDPYGQGLGYKLGVPGRT